MTRTPTDLATAIDPPADASPDELREWKLALDPFKLRDAAAVLRTLTPSAGHKQAAEEIRDMRGDFDSYWPEKREAALQKAIAIIARCCPAGGVDEGVEIAAEAMVRLLDKIPHRDGAHLRLHIGHPAYDNLVAAIRAKKGGAA